MLRVAAIAIASLALAACATPTVDDGRVQVVASTNVYGSIVDAIGGEHVSVTNLIDSAAHDPHSFEASAQAQLAISKADLVIENGGGYDDFVQILLDAASSDAVVITASETSGLLEDAHADEEEGDEHGHIEGFNEHVWYSFHGVEHIAQQIAVELIALDPNNAAAYESNLADFVAEIATLEASAEALHELTEGSTVAITEPVPVYLLAEVGLTNVTPDAFSEAIEEGTDVAPAVLAETLDIVGTVVLLAYNSQTASAETEKLRQAAEEAGVPIVEFTETLPDGEDYISWMTENLAAIAAAIE